LNTTGQIRDNKSCCFNAIVRTRALGTMVDKTLSAADLPRLVVHLPDGKEIHHTIAGTEITIGRDPSNRISIADNFVSKFHAKLIMSGAGMILMDLGSANKSYVNGRPVSGQTPVQYGDEIQFAGVRCRLLAPDAAPASAPAPPPPPPPAPRAQPKAAAKPAPVSAPPPRSKPQVPAAGPARSAPPKIEADPMQRLLRIGGLLILVSLALGILLRVLLVPSSSPSTEEGEKSASPATTSAPAAVASESATTSVPAPVSVPTGTTAQDYFDQALSYLDTGRLKEAQVAFRKVLELDPDNPRAKTRLSLLDEEISQKAERHFGNAQQAFQFLRYEEAIAEWEIFLTLADLSDVRYAEAQQGIEQAKAKLRR
jgi:hypothetical protein